MKRYLLLGVFVLFVGLLHAQPLLVGHRGSGYGVENTEEAFRRGAELGYQYVETDIKVTKDTRFVLTHDDNLSRWGHENLVVASSTLAELQAVTLTQTRSGATYTGKLMELGEFLDLCTELKVKPVIELKWGTGVNSNDQSNMPALIKTIEDHGHRNTCVILTSMKPCLEWISTNHPDITLQLLLGSSAVPANHLEWCKKYHADVDMEASVCTDASVELYHEAGIKVNMWTTNTEDGYKTYATMGCDFITTDRLDGNNLPAYEPKVVLPTIEGDYPDPLAGSTLTPSAEYTFRQEYIEQPIAALEGKSIRRVVAHGDYVYILALDATNQPTIFCWHPIRKETIMVSTAGMTVPAVIAKAEAERLLACSDIQVTQDGYLVATNVAETNDAGAGIVTLYKWEKDANGLPTGNPFVWIQSQTNGSFPNAYAGETFAYAGTAERGIAYLSAEAINSTANIRLMAIPIIDGTATERAFLHSIPPARGYMKRAKIGEDYRFTLSPLASEHVFVTGSGDGAILADFEFVKKGNTSPIELPEALVLPTEITHIGCFTFAGAAYAAVVAENAIRLLDVSNGVENATIVPTINTTFEATEKPCAAVGQVYPTCDEEGNVVRGDIDLFLLCGDKASLFTTRENTDALHDVTVDNLPVVYYTLMGMRVPMEQLTTGFYIRQQGGQATKLFVP